MSVMRERRFERYCASIVATLGHADRHAPAWWYLKGLLLPGARKSVEPAAYGNDAAFRDGLSERQLDSVLGVRVTTQVWGERHQPAPVNPAARGRPRRRLRRDAQHQPMCWRWHARCRPSNGAP